MKNHLASIMYILSGLLLFPVSAWFPQPLQAQQWYEYLYPSVTFANADITPTSILLRAKIPVLTAKQYSEGTPLSLIFMQGILRIIGISAHTYTRTHCPAMFEIDKDGWPLDSAITFQIVVGQLTPGTSYSYRIYNDVTTYATGAQDPQTFLIEINPALSFATPPLPVSATPTPLPARLLFAEGATLVWQPPTGTSPSHYLLDVATDAAFRFPLPGLSGKVVADTAFRFGGLLPATPFFWRVRAVVAGQTTAFSPIRKDISPAFRRFNADQMSVHDLVRSVPRIPRSSQIDFCAGKAPFYAQFYAYATGASISFPQTDSLLVRLLDAGFPVDSAWAQDNSRCDGTNNGTSELLVRLSADDPRIRSFGFSKRYNDWQSSSECRNYRLYYNFGKPVAVRSVGESGTDGQTPIVSPNPAHAGATLRYALAAPCRVRAEVTDMLGRAVLVLPEAEREGGEHTEELNTEGLPAGVYAVRLFLRDARGGIQTRTLRLTLLR